MKPQRIFLFVLMVLAGLSILMLSFPKDGIKINDDTTLQFETWNEFLNPVRQKDISDILASNEIVEDSINIVDPIVDNTDTAYIDSVQIVYTPIQIEVDSTLQIIEFPKNNDTLLYPFYRQLAKVKNKHSKIHIIHYGDSQIEVDRMTSFIRYKMQRTFGGYGCGYHSGIQAFDFTEPMIVKYSDNWHRYFLFPHKDSLITHKRFGINSFFTTFKALDDSTEDVINASIKFSNSPTAYSNVKHFTHLSIYMGNVTYDLNIKIFADEALIGEKIISPKEGLQIIGFDFAHSPKNIKIEYSSIQSPEIYGYIFDTPSGVFVDNMPVRGSGGTFFGGFDFSLAAQIYSSLNTRLILLQFGGNAISEDTNYIKSYVRWFSKQLGYLHTMAPKAQIIIIGAADMSEKMKNSYVTRSTLPFLIKKMKEAALKNDCAFWNMYEAMGGENSMPSWVFHNPPLAEKDFIHFTPQGAKIVAIMFYKSLMYDYNKFINSQNTK